MAGDAGGMIQLLHPELDQLDRDDPAVALAEDTEARAVLCVAPPDDDELAGAHHGVGGDGRIALIARRVGVDAELGAEGGAGAVVALAEDTVAQAVLPVALPGHDEVAGGVRGHGRSVLVARRKRVDAELRADRGAGAGVALAEDAEA